VNLSYYLQKAKAIGDVKPEEQQAIVGLRGVTLYDGTLDPTALSEATATFEPEVQAAAEKGATEGCGMTPLAPVASLCGVIAGEIVSRVFSKLEDLFSDDTDNREHIFDDTRSDRFNQIWSQLSSLDVDIHGQSDLLRWANWYVDAWMGEGYVGADNQDWDAYKEGWKQHYSNDGKYTTTLRANVRNIVMSSRLRREAEFLRLVTEMQNSLTQEWLPKAHGDKAAQQSMRALINEKPFDILMAARGVGTTPADVQYDSLRAGLRAAAEQARTNLVAGKATDEQLVAMDQQDRLTKDGETPSAPASAAKKKGHPVLVGLAVVLGLAAAGAGGVAYVRHRDGKPWKPTDWRHPLR